MRRLLAILLVPLLVLAACGDDDDGGADRGAEDERIARDAVLRADDLPAGWEATPSEDDDDDFDLDEECEELEEISDRNTAEADSDDFEKDQAQIQSNVALFEDEGDAEEAMAAVRSDTFAGCVEEVVQESIEESFRDDPGTAGLQVPDIAIEDLEPPDAGDESAGLRMRITLSDGTTELEAIGDFVFVRVGRAAALFSFLAFGGPLEEGRDDAVSAVVGRLDDAV